MPKVVGLCCCFYGCDYISWALRAVAPFVDEVYVMLTDQPSHGTITNLVCPDSPDEMRRAILDAGIEPFKLRLIEGRWNSEGAHRNAIYKYVSPGDLIVVMDCDEIWTADNLKLGIGAMQAAPDIGWYKVRMTTLFRSFNWACTDPMMQDRIIRVSGSSSIIYSPFSVLPNNPDLWHMGYCRAMKDMEFKWSQHGHQSELRPGWLERFKNWKPGEDDMHPTCDRFWNPRPFDKRRLPDDLKNHPYFDLALIE